MKTENNILDHIKVKAKPEVDAAYFENLAASVLSQVKTDPIPVKRIIFLRPSFWVSGVAAVTVLFFGIRYFVDETAVNFKDLQHQEILAYVEENLDDFDEEALAESVVADHQAANLPEDSILTVTAAVQDSTQTSILPAEKPVLKSSKELMESITKEDILQYLNNEEIDLEDLDESLF